MAVEPYRVELDPDTGTTLEVHLLRNVSNAEHARAKVVSGAWKCAIVKPSLVAHPFQVAVAANRAVLAEMRNSLVTRSVFSEILFNLSPSNNISHSLSTFGIEDGDEMLVCVLRRADGAPDDDVVARIEGERRPADELRPDVARLRALHALAPSSDGRLLDALVTRQAAKGLLR